MSKDFLNFLRETWGLWVMWVVSVTLLVWSLTLTDTRPCTAIGAATTESGALYIVRECRDGRIIREFPFFGEE